MISEIMRSCFYIAKMIVMYYIITIILFCITCPCCSYHLTKPQAKLYNLRSQIQSITKLNMDSSSMMEALMQQVDPELAKGEFFFFFFAGGGALSFGITLLPKLLKQFQAVQALKGGISLGGEELGFNLLTSLSYPEPIRVKDIKNILDKMPSIAVLQQKGPKKSFIAKGGYIEREGFEAVFPSKSFNPVAKYAFFDALSSGNGDIASPEACAQAIAKWKGTNGIEAFKSDLTTGLAKKLSAYAVFIFLITLVLDLILESGINGFLTK